jgi:hypothetical protein
MSKKVCFFIYVIALATILISHIIDFRPISSNIENVYTQMSNIYIAISSIILSLLLRKHKFNFLIQLGLAFVVTSIIQVFVAHAPLFSISLLYKVMAYIVYYYLTIQVFYMI